MNSPYGVKSIRPKCICLFFYEKRNKDGKTVTANIESKVN